jgi:homocysteine S-methyltransferase
MYFSTPGYFGSQAVELALNGADLIGGCCGTTPDHIHAVAGALASLTPVKMAVRSPAKPVLVPTPGQTPLRPASSFREKLQEGKFVITVEVEPPKGTDLSGLITVVENLKECGIDAVNIPDSPLARVRTSPIAVAVRIKQLLDLEAIIHMTCRDRNLLGLQAELLGADALGVHNILVLTGDPPQIGDHPEATPVFDLNSEGLLALLSRLNAGFDYTGNCLNASSSFYIGVACNPAAANMEQEIERLYNKVNKGARFAITQPLYDLDLLERFVEAARGLDIKIIAGILPLYSYKNALFLHNEVPGIIVPEKVRQHLADTPQERQAEEGVRFAREMIAAVKDLVSGIYITPPFGKFAVVQDLIKSR